MKIAVTGGAGFIGAAAIRWGQRGAHEMWSFDRNDGFDVMGNLDALRGADAVIHLAGVLGTDELFDSVENAVQINVLGSARVMQWCVRHDAAYVGIVMPDVFPSIYTATKVGAHRLAQAMAHNGGLRMAHVRAFNAYGPGQKHGLGHPQKIIPTFATNAWQRRPLPIFGSGLQTVDLVHVDDVGRALVEAALLLEGLDRPIQKDVVIDAGTGVALTVRQVALTVGRIAGWSEPELEQLPMRRGEVETDVVAKGDGWGALSFRPRHDYALLAETVLSYR